MYSLEWLHVLSVDVTHDVAHLHCHQGPEQDDAVLILVGYNGIAYPSLTFPQVIQIINQNYCKFNFFSRHQCYHFWMHWRMDSTHKDAWSHHFGFYGNNRLILYREQQAFPQH